MPVDSGLAVQMLELKLQESTHVDDSDEVDIAVQRAGLQDLLERVVVDCFISSPLGRGECG